MKWNDCFENSLGKFFVKISCAYILLLVSAICFGNQWSKVESPSHGPAKTIGSVSCGCVAGAVNLPEMGLGYQVMHLERNRNFGHPALTGAVETIGAEVAKEKLGTLHVGDLAQPRGGPLPSHHVSHQNGLDADVWFTLDSGATDISGAPSFTNDTGTSLDHSLWKKENSRVLEIVARMPQVDRIFVNPQIKGELCRIMPKNDRAWLRKIRPWWGHDDHFHMRLSCPAGNKQCKQQASLPQGDGCDASLDHWLHLKTTMPSGNAKPLDDTAGARVPPACKKILTE